MDMRIGDRMPHFGSADIYAIPGGWRILCVDFPVGCTAPSTDGLPDTVIAGSAETKAVPCPTLIRQNDF